MKHMTREEAQSLIELEMGRIVNVDRFDQSEFGDSDVVVAYYGFIDNTGRSVVVRYRVQVFVNGERSFGGEVVPQHRTAVHAVDCDMDEDCSCGAGEEMSRG